MRISHQFEDLVSLQDYMQGFSDEFDVDQDMNTMCAASPSGVRITITFEAV